MVINWADECVTHDAILSRYAWEPVLRPFSDIFKLDQYFPSCIAGWKGEGLGARSLAVQWGLYG